MIIGLDKSQAGTKINHKGLWCYLTGYYQLERALYRNMIIQHWQANTNKGLTWIKHTIRPIKPDYEKVLTM